MCVCVCVHHVPVMAALLLIIESTEVGVCGRDTTSLSISQLLCLFYLSFCVCVCVFQPPKKKVAIRRGESDGRETSTIHVLYIVYVYNIDFAITYEGLRWLSFNDRSSLSPWWNMHMEVGSRMKQPRSSLYQIYHPYFICFLPMLVCSTFSFAFWIFFFFFFDHSTCFWCSQIKGWPK